MTNYKAISIQSKCTVFWDMTMCSLVELCQFFVGKEILHLRCRRVKQQAQPAYWLLVCPAYSSALKMDDLLPSYQTTRRHILIVTTGRIWSLTYCAIIFLEGTNKIMRDIQKCRFPARDVNPAPPDEVGMPRNSVSYRPKYGPSVRRNARQTGRKREYAEVLTTSIQYH